MEAIVTVIRKPTLILTATVTPSYDMPQLYIKDPGLRLRQYSAVLERIVRVGSYRHFNRIVVAENSGYDMGLFKEILSDADIDCRYVSLPASLTALYGRGFAEMTLLDRVLQDAFALDDLKDTDLIWKITGRYDIKNLSKIVTSDIDADIIVNLRKYPRRWADMHVFAFNKTGWTHLRKSIDALKEGGKTTSAEISMFDIIQCLRGSRFLTVKTRLPVEPHICGLRGSDGREYDSGKQRIKRYIRQMARLVAPKLAV